MKLKQESPGMNLMTTEPVKRQRRETPGARKPKLMPSSFRGLPGVMEPLMAYMATSRRTLNGQLDIIFDNALRRPAQVREVGKGCLVTKEYATAASETSPRSFRISQDKLDKIRAEAHECAVG